MATFAILQNSITQLSHISCRRGKEGWMASLSEVLFCCRRATLEVCQESRQKCVGCDVLRREKKPCIHNKPQGERERCVCTKTGHAWEKQLCAYHNSAAFKLSSWLLRLCQCPQPSPCLWPRSLWPLFAQLALRIGLHDDFPRGVEDPSCEKETLKGQENYLRSLWPLQPGFSFLTATEIFSPHIPRRPETQSGCPHSRNSIKAPLPNWRRRKILVTWFFCAIFRPLLVSPDFCFHTISSVALTLFPKTIWRPLSKKNGPQFCSWRKLKRGRAISSRFI